MSRTRIPVPIQARTMLPVHDGRCGVARTCEVLRGKWTIPIVAALLGGPLRFTALEQRCAGISPRTLCERLRSLEAAGLVDRRCHDAAQPRVEYSLTARGHALLPIVEELQRFDAQFGTAGFTGRVPGHAGA